MGMDFIRQVLSESQKVWLAHARGQGFIKVRLGPWGTKAGALRDLQLHHQVKRQGIPRAALN